MARKKQRKSSIFSRLLMPLIVIVLLTIALLVVLLSVGGAFQKMEDSALNSLDERTGSMRQSLQLDMVSRWSNLEPAAEVVEDVIQRRLTINGADVQDMKISPALNADIMLNIAPELLTQLRMSSTTGIFVVLDGLGVADQPESLAGVYLRDSDPTSNTSTNSDVLLLRGLPPVSRELGISLDSYWAASCNFTTENQDIFYKPLEAAQHGTSAVAAHYGRWCMPFQLNEDNPVPVIAYSMPIFSKEGQALGVIGVDVSVNYLTNRLNSDAQGRGNPMSYALGMLQEDGSIRIACTSGTIFKQYFNTEDEVLVPQKTLHNNNMILQGTRNGKQMYASVMPLELYSPNTAFEDERWVLVGMQTAESLLAFSEQFKNMVAMAVVVAIAFSLVIAAFTSGNLIKPIKRLVKQVEEAEPGNELQLDETNIAEIDTLADAIETLNHNALENAARFTTIMQMTGLRVGAFELKKDEDTVYCSPEFIDLLDMNEVPRQNDRISRETFGRVMRDRFTDAYDDDVWRFRVRGEELYLRYKQVEHDDYIVGTLVDVTNEINTRIDLERARDIDSLTGILNRRAFARLNQELFGRRRETLGMAALIMVDLDNLKFLNSTYGHDTGDNFIRAFAHALGAFEKENQSIVARRSGDEFYMVLYGYDNRVELENHIETAWNQVSSQGIVLPDGSFYRFRASGGVAWFPDDADTFSKLLHYADFAMYKVKQDAKGSLRYFDKALFNEESYLIDARAALDRLIDNQLLHYAYQPIVSVKTAELWGYELLMRPDVPELKNPGAVLRLAKEQGKLHHIERLTWFCGLESARVMMDRGLLSKDMKLFINSIASQKMDLTERQHIIDCYTDLLPQVVLEVTEAEDNNKDFTERKMKFIRGNGGQVAIDDYGTGYNSELALVEIPCEYVKVDASFVRDVDKDPNKQALVKNLMSYAKARNIAVLAEGVETRSEMETMINFGVDYLQGFYLGMPREKPQQVLQSIRMEIRDMTWRMQHPEQ